MPKWECPHCRRPQISTAENTHSLGSRIRVGESEFGYDGGFGYVIESIACLNEDCKKVTVELTLASPDQQYSDFRPKRIYQHWRLRPESSAKPQPDYIPKAIVEDYFEACRIRDLSPKASATLARRCLQGMIRDFAGISKSRLIDEVRDLRSAVDEGKAPQGVTRESVDAIDNVRSIGNIGAHMEKDVDLIIEIDPDEAQVLIELIETLFEDWYVERQARAERFGKLAAIRAEKDAIKAAGGAALQSGDDSSPLTKLMNLGKSEKPR